LKLQKHFFKPSSCSLSASTSKLSTGVGLFELETEVEEGYLFVELSAGCNKNLRGYKCDAL